MIISAHQPNFLPYSGFWWKLANSDVLDLRYRAQFTVKGYMRRVMMRDNWCTLPLEGSPRYEPINEIRLKPEARTEVMKTIAGRYRGARHYKTRGQDLLDKIETLDTPYMWEFNMELILYIRDVLGITTPIALGLEAIGGKAEGTLSLMRAYPHATTYLSGNGAKKYMEDTSIFDEAGIKVKWATHEAVTHDSIVTILMDYNNPLEIVMREKN
jgi:hypothetical protein